MHKHLLHVIVAAVAGASGAVTQAATVNLSGWAYGNSWGNVVDVVSANDPLANSNGGAGAFIGSVAFSGNEGGFSGSIDSFVSYCVELTESIYLPSGNIAGYSVVAGAAYGEWNSANANGRTSLQTANRLGQLLNYASSNGLVQTAAQSTSMQLAIWNVIYDTDNSLNAGIFRDLQPASAYDAYANQLLSGSLAWGATAGVYVLSKSGSQDLLLTAGNSGRLGGANPSAVPEPGSLALAALAVLAMGFVGGASRRRACSPEAALPRVISGGG